MTTLCLTYASLLVACATICIAYVRGYKHGYREGHHEGKRPTELVLPTRRARMIHGRN